MTKRRSLTTGEVADFCGVNFRTVIRWLERGLLTAYKLPGRGDNRILLHEFMRFLRENSMPIPEEFLDHSRRVLIVEDEPPVARSIRRVLNEGGYETEIAPDGFRAGSLLGTFKPGLVTLDLKMPGLSGLDVLKYIRGTSEYAQTKVLVVSALDQSELDRAVASGADGALAKPFKNEELLEKVAQILAKQV